MFVQWQRIKGVSLVRFGQGKVQVPLRIGHISLLHFLLIDQFGQVIVCLIFLICHVQGRLHGGVCLAKVVSGKIELCLRNVTFNRFWKLMDEIFHIA